MTKSELKAQEYRTRAEDTQASAESADLVSVREQRQRAAAIWFGMAEAEERRVLEALARVSSIPRLAAPITG